MNVKAAAALQQTVPLSVISAYKYAYYPNKSILERMVKYTFYCIFVK